jgi:hypothetical protein
MSRWMHPKGAITYTGSPKDAVALILEDLPQGSEGPASYTIYTSPTTQVTDISIDGHLRDRGWQSDIDDVRRWFKGIIASAHVPHAWIEIQTSGMFVCGMYFHDGVFTEITIPPGFIELEDPD